METAKQSISEIMLQAQRNDPEHMSRTRRAMKPYLDQFSAQLGHIYNIMPRKIRVTENGVEDIIEPEWQALIDKVKQQQDATLRDLFPEFYP
jgi:hypothetical protein